MAMAMGLKFSNNYFEKNKLYFSRKKSLVKIPTGRQVQSLVVKVVKRDQHNQSKCDRNKYTDHGDYISKVPNSKNADCKF